VVLEAFILWVVFHDGRVVEEVTIYGETASTREEEVPAPGKAKTRGTFMPRVLCNVID